MKTKQLLNLNLTAIAAVIFATATNAQAPLPGEGNSHGRDEKLRTKSFYDGLDFLDKLVRRLSSP